MKNMIVRAMSGAVYVALIVICCLLGSSWMTALLWVFSMLAMREIYTLFSKETAVPICQKVIDYILVTAMFVVVFCIAVAPGLYIIPVIVPATALVVALLYLAARIIAAVFDKNGTPLRSILVSFAAIIYAAFPLVILAIVPPMSHLGTKITLVTFMMIWVNDTGAYISGMSFGKRKLCERLSPKKTWEGFWGGFILTVCAGFAIGCYFAEGVEPSATVWMAYAALVSVVGTFGDLFESLVKRTLGVKDSGNLIPGHGGILDRIDSILAVAPLTCLIIIFA